MTERAIEALARLKAGNERYIAAHRAHPGVSARLRGELVGGQDPFGVVLTCADSRVVPELIFDATIGDLFVTSVAGNVLSAEVIGTIEYAVLQLGTPLVLILGHQGCGAVTAAVEGARFGNSIDSLIEAMQDSVSAVRGKEGDLVDNCVRQNAIDVRAELLERSPEMAELATAGRLQVVAGYYALDTGVVTWL